MKVPEAPKSKALAVVDNSDNITMLVDRVRTFDGDIRQFKDHIDTLKEQIEEIIEGLPIYQQISELSEKLNRLRAELKNELMAVSQYNDLMEQLADEQDALKDAKANLSDFLLGYFAETRERQVELGPERAREVKLSARLGKEIDYQTSIFARGDDGR